LFTEAFGYSAVFKVAAAMTLLALLPAMLFFRASARGASGRVTA
jgi:hypothetical protein